MTSDARTSPADADRPEAPAMAPLTALEPEWIDYNGHLNMAYYNVLFDRAADHAFDWLGCGAAYRAQRALSVYTAEIHVCYLREVAAGERVRATYRLLDHDAKRLHGFQELRHESGWIAATCEVLHLHVDTRGPKVAPFPPDIMSRVEAMAAAHDDLDRPERVGRRIAIVRKVPDSA